MDDLQFINDNTKDSYYTSSDTGRYKMIEKIHRAMGHKSDVSMIRLFKEAGKGDANTNKLNSDVVDKCKTCLVCQKTKPKPKVCLRNPMILIPL